MGCGKEALRKIVGRSYRELGYEAVSTRDEDATQSEVLIWSYEALDVDSSGYAMKVAGITPGGPFRTVTQV